MRAVQDIFVLFVNIKFIKKVFHPWVDGQGLALLHKLLSLLLHHKGALRRLPEKNVNVTTI